MIVSKVFAVWIMNIVRRNIFQIKFKYWSSSLNLVPHVKDWNVTWWHNQMETFAGLLVLHRSQVDSPPKGQWHGALMFSLICAKINFWVINCEAGDLRRYCAHHDVVVMNHGSQQFWKHVESISIEFAFYLKKNPDTFPLCLQWTGWMTLNVQLCLSTSGTKCTK